MADVVERLARAITEKDIEGYGSLYREDAAMYEPLLSEPARGREQIMAGEALLFDAFSDIAIQVRTVFSRDDRVMAEVVLSATNDGPLDLGTGEPLPATQQRVEIPMVWVFDLDDEGLIIEERDYFDTGVIMQQLGLGVGG
ncbi:MAG: ester cyclase [Actinomycetota bacterium]|nr:ester cyclase [Actinomycetota bacterium]